MKSQIHVLRFTHRSLHVNFCRRVLATSADAACDEPIIPSGNPALIYINGYDENTENHICVAVAGTQTDDIGTDAKYGAGVENPE